MGVLGFLSMIYIAYKIVGEEWGNGDFYRNMGKMYEQQGRPDLAKYQYKKANDSDGAVALCVLFLGFVGIIFIVALVGTV